MACRHVVSSSSKIFAFGADVKPAAFVEDGDEVVFETLDCFSNQIRTSEDKLEVRSRSCNRSCFCERCKAGKCAGG